MIGTIASREFRGLFLSPLAWTVLAVVSFIMAWIFLLQVDQFMVLQPRLAAYPAAPGVTDLVAAPLYNSAAIILLLVVPLMSMRLVAEERRSGTLTLLRSAPVSVTDIVLGKYLGLLGFLGVLLALVALMPLSLGVGTTLDYGKWAAGALGLGLLLAAFGAAGLFMSTLTRQPVIAAVSSFGLLLMLWLIDLAGHGDSAATGASQYLSMLTHYQALLKGTFNSGDVVYYLLVIVGFLVFSIRKLDADRLQK